MVVTSTYIVEEKMPILIVSHEDDEEGGSLWQFHCGNGNYDMDKMLLVRLDTIIHLDPKIIDVLSIPLGTTVKREYKDASWEYQ